MSDERITIVLTNDTTIECSLPEGENFKKFWSENKDSDIIISENFVVKRDELKAVFKLPK